MSEVSIASQPHKNIEKKSKEEKKSIYEQPKSVMKVSNKNTKNPKDVQNLFPDDQGGPKLI